MGVKDKYIERYLRQHIPGLTKWMLYGKTVGVETKEEIPSDLIARICRDLKNYFDLYFLGRWGIDEFLGMACIALKLPQFIRVSGNTVFLYVPNASPDDLRIQQLKHMLADSMGLELLFTSSFILFRMNLHSEQTLWVRNRIN
jgi:hypothetical protein